MAQVVLGEQQLLLGVELGRELLQLLGSMRFWNSFSRSHTGMAMRKEENPLGAKLR